ncbi:MAG: mechanosensitive ion channel [Proteobacteria bacterium]|nr:mechanosensitive ion channel [Pseudomonadota bacterium]
MTTALATPRGLMELAMIGVCVGAAYLTDQRVWHVRVARADHRHLTGGFARLAFPLTAVMLLLFARALVRHTGPTPFINIAFPMFVALAAIRLVVYALRTLFADASWVRTSELSVSFVIWGAVVLHLTGVLPQLAETLDDFVIPVGRGGISVLTILKGMIAVVLTLGVALWISSLIEQRVMKAQFDINLRVVLVKVIRAILLVLAVLVALDAIGFDLTLLTVFGGALGVGIGLGLQKLASNYIAGFTILLDRSIRMNDRVTVGDRTGRITRLTSRYVVLRANDGVEAIVPNETMVTSIVLNHSATPQETRIVVPVAITYDSDVALAMKLMADVAAREPRVTARPWAPQVFLMAFGDNGYQLELNLWIADPQNGQDNLRSAINRAIVDAFAAHHIRIARPAREFRLVSAGGGPDVPSAPSDAPAG